MYSLRYCLRGCQFLWYQPSSSVYIGCRDSGGANAPPPARYATHACMPCGRRADPYDSCVPARVATCCTAHRHMHAVCPITQLPPSLFHIDRRHYYIWVRSLTVSHFLCLNISIFFSYYYRFIFLRHYMSNI